MQRTSGKKRKLGGCSSSNVRIQSEGNRQWERSVLAFTSSTSAHCVFLPMSRHHAVVSTGWR